MPEHPLYVRHSGQLAEALQDLERSPRAAFDTEFVGEGTYEPVLCLIQIATDDGLWIIDPLERLDLTPFWKAITAPERELVVLAAREEIRFCLRYAGRPPAHLTDVQIAAGLVGHGYPLSHTNMVRKLLNVRVQAGETFTDWRKRPLSEKQLEYAADDVRHLLGIRDLLHREAAELDREPWIAGECEAYVHKVCRALEDERWSRLPGSASLSRRELAVLREVWRRREEEAQRHNQPPRRILRDELLVEIAKRKPHSVPDLQALRGMDRGGMRDLGPRIVEAVARGLALPEADLPTSLRREDPPQLTVLGQILAVVSNGLAAGNRVDPQLLATTSDLQDVVRWELGRRKGEEPAVLQGWRGEILREALTSILEGRRGLRVGDLCSANPLVLE
jgi:ribonuclease D